jgi:copper chaperone NosL
MRNLQKMLFLVVAALVFSGVAGASEGHNHHQHNAALTSPAHAADLKEFPDCLICGMDRNAFAHSRMEITYVDGTKVGTCSLACAVTEQKKNPGKKIGTIKVANYYTKELIEAEKAIWVIGGKKSGVMTSVAKWAFEARKDAEKFTKENGGKIATFQEAMKKAEGEN